jgi:hypothetical protein
MKISQAIAQFYGYQRMNVKKKYVAQLGKISDAEAMRCIDNLHG